MRARTFNLALAALALAGGGMAVGYHTGVHDSPSIPRCHHDDYNDGTQELCYTVTVDTGGVIVLDSDDEYASIPVDHYSANGTH